MQVCVVTGAARGLGNGFCDAFIQSCVSSLVHGLHAHVTARGCTQLAIIDLKENEARAAADELVQNACGQWVGLGVKIGY